MPDRSKPESTTTAHPTVRLQGGGDKEEDQCENIEKEMTSGSSKEAHNTLKALTETQQLTSAVTEDSSGNILMESTAVLNRWTEYCSGLYN